MEMKFAFIGVVVFSGCFLTVLAAPIVPAQADCAEGEPAIGDIQPDVNLTVLPSTNIESLSNISVICNAGTPRFPNSSANASNLPPTNIKIYVGTFQVNECINITRCVYNLQTFFPDLPRAISCTAANTNGDCRFKVENITLIGETTVAPPIPTTITTAAPTTAPTDDDTDESEDETEESEDSDSD